jgi:tetratricopeptide (TPR) repeat protein
MELRNIFGVAGTVIAALCISVQSAYSQSNGRKQEVGATQTAQRVSDKDKDKKEAGNSENKEVDSKETEKKAIDKKVDAKQADAKKDDQKDESKSPVWLASTTAILDKLLSWVVVAILFLVLFRSKLEALFDSVIVAMSERGVTLEVAKVKIQVSERAHDLYEDRSARFSVSPFDLERDGRERFADAVEIPPQLTFQVSDYVAQWWASRNKHLVAEADKQFEELKKKIGTVSGQAEAVKEVIPFARALEKARFIWAVRLKDLFEANRSVRDQLVDLAKTAPAGSDEKMVVHATGVAYAQSAVWSTARSLLEPIAWTSGRPGYLPAADVWLAAMYHDCIEKARKPASNSTPDGFVKELIRTADDVVAKAEFTLAEMAKSPWDPPNDNMAYYRREVNKLLGTVSSIRADYSAPTESEEHLQRALRAHRACAGTIGGEGPSPLDHNNLADTYRQLGRFDKSQYPMAHAEIEKALASCGDDPTFLNTESLIFIDEKRLIEALAVLTAVPQKIATTLKNSQDLAQYLDNQILAAKIASRTDRPKTLRLCEAGDILEAALRFLDANATRLDESDALRLRAELYELLGFTYLGLDGYERRSVDCYESVARCSDAVSVSGEVRWRRRLGAVRAYTRLARIARRDFDYGTAIDQRKRGRKVFADNLDELAVLGVGVGQLQVSRLRHALIHLDTAMALQGLAEESFQGREFEDAKLMLDKKDAIVAALRDFRECDAVGPKIKLAWAHTGLLRGLLAVRGDPGTYEPAVLTDIEKNLVSARGHSGLLDCQIDLALGEAFLAASLSGRESDAVANWRKAIDALEMAVGREAPDLRADATRALIDAYAKRPVVQRRAKAKESKAT